MPLPSQRDENIWFPRFGDIPGIKWNSQEVDRARLPGHDARPQPSEWGDESNWWPSLEGGEEASTTATPAQQYVGGDWSEAKTVGDVLHRLAEALELPGNPSDYHFLIAGAQERLWKLRLAEPRALGEIERLCLLDIELVRARPEIIAPYREGEPTLHMEVLETLYRLHIREGNLTEAEEVVRMAISEFDQARFKRHLEELQERRAVLAAEDA